MNDQKQFALDMVRRDLQGLTRDLDQLQAQAARLEQQWEQVKTAILAQRGAVAYAEDLIRRMTEENAPAAQESALAAEPAPVIRAELPAGAELVPNGVLRSSDNI